MKERAKYLYPEHLKTCLEEALSQGIQENPPERESNSKRRIAVQFLTMDFKRIGHDQDHIEKELIMWNMEKNKPRLDEKDMMDVIDWSFKLDGELGCTGKLVEHGFCFRDKRQCNYFNEFIRINQGIAKHDDSLYDLYGWPDFLVNKYKNGYVADCVYRQLRIIRLKRGLPQEGIIYIGCQSLATIVMQSYRDIKPDAMRVLSAIHNLEKAGLVLIKEKGCPGTFNGRANGYVIIYPIPKPS